MTNEIIWGAIGAATFIVDELNTSGSAPCPLTKPAEKILPLGDALVTIGTSGYFISKFSGVALGIGIPNNVGMISRDAVANIEEGIAFVDTSKGLRILSAAFKLSDGEFTEALSVLGDDITLNYDQVRGELFITDGLTCFIRTKYGLSESSQCIFQYISSGSLEQVVLTDNTAKEYAQITTSSFDFGSRGDKSIDVIEVGLSSTGKAYLTVSSKATKSSNWEVSQPCEINDSGAVVIPASGVEFKFTVKFDTIAGARIDYIRPRVKFTDNRYKRGRTYASTTYA